MICLVLFIHFGNGFQRTHHFIAGLHLFFRVETIITIAAGLIQFLAKIIQQHNSAANSGLCIRSSIQQQLPPDLLLGNRLALHKLFKFLNILIRIECNALPLAAITSCPSGFLVITFQAFGNIIVHHKTHIGLINPHPKGNGCDNNIHVFHQKLVLISRPGGRIHAGMISQGLDSVHLQRLGQLFHFLTAQAINNP